MVLKKKTKFLKPIEYQYCGQVSQSGYQYYLILWEQESLGMYKG
jgi:hypothetical protein